MPSSKPRITVLLDPATYHVIEEYSKALGVSKSSVVSSLCQASAVPLARTLALLRAAAAAPESVYAGLAEAIERAGAELQHFESDAQMHIDHILDGIGFEKPKPKPKAKSTRKQQKF